MDKNNKNRLDVWLQHYSEYTLQIKPLNGLKEGRFHFDRLSIQYKWVKGRNYKEHVYVGGILDF